MNFPQIAQQVIDKLGGKENIATAAHCATRLRIVLNDESKVDKEGIDNIEGVKGQFAVAGQYQIIFGSGTVNKVHAELTKLLGIGDVSKAEVAEAASGNQNLLQRLVKGLADIFVPIIPAIVAGGLLMGIHSMLTAKGFFVDELSVIDMHPGLADLVDFINTIANAPFVFLPVLLGFSATRKFGGNPFLGAALGMLLVHPALADGWNYALTLAQGKIQYWNVFGLEIEKVGYQGTVIPTLVSAWAVSYTHLDVYKRQVLTLTPAELLEAKAQNISILSYLANKFDNPYISYFAPLVAFFAITSSFFGHYLGAREGLEGLYLKMKGESVNRKKLNYGTAVFFLLTLWGVAIINPSILGLIESLGGPIIAMILFIMPMYAIRNVPAMKRYQGRFSNVFVTVMGLIAISAVVYGLL